MPLPARGVGIVTAAVGVLVVALSAATIGLAHDRRPDRVGMGSTSAPASSAPVVATPTATPTPLACADLAQDAAIVRALSGPASSGAATATPVSAPDASLAGAMAIEGAGGLSCTWRVGSALLTADVLPGAADAWSAMLGGDAPTPARRTFAGVSAAAACADPGCSASMVVGTSWVRVDLLPAGFSGDASVFGNESPDTIFANARPAIESVVGAVRGASPAQLTFPAHTGKAAGECSAVLAPTALAKAMGVGSAKWADVLQPAGVTTSIVGAAQHRFGTLACFGQGAGSSPDGIAQVTVEPGQAWAVAALGQDAAARGDLKATTVGGRPALSSCTSARHPCTLILALGDDAVEVEDTAHPVPIAEAMAAARG